MSQLAEKTPVTYQSIAQFNEKYSDTLKTFTFDKYFFGSSFYFINSQTNQNEYVLRYDNWFDYNKTMYSADEIPLLRVEKKFYLFQDLLFHDFKGLPEMKGSLVLVRGIRGYFKSQLEDITLCWFMNYTLGGRVIKGSLEYNGSPLIKVEKSSWIWPNSGKVTIDMEAILNKFPQWADRKDTLESFLLTIAPIVFRRFFHKNAGD